MAVGADRFRRPVLELRQFASHKELVCSRLCRGVRIVSNRHSFDPIPRVAEALKDISMDDKCLRFFLYFELDR